MLSPNDILKRCNEIRKAGGAEELDSLQPGVASEPGSCLIARNLNFDSRIVPGLIPYAYGVVITKDPNFASIAERFGFRQLGAYTYELPNDLNESARAFDRCGYPEEYYARG